MLELYSWHDGVRLDRPAGYEEWEIAPSLYFPPLDYAVGTYHRLRDVIGKIDPLPGSTPADYWRATWFPILRTQGPEHFVVSCGEHDDGTVWFVSWEEPSLRAFTSLADLADQLRMRITSGAYTVDPSGRLGVDIEVLLRTEERPLPHVW